MSSPHAPHWPPPRPETRRGDLPPPAGIAVPPLREHPRRWGMDRHRVTSILLASASMFASLVCVTFFWDSRGGEAFLTLAGWIAGAGVAYLVTRRDDMPGWLVCASVAFSLLLRGDPFGALVGTAVLVRQGRWRDAAFGSVGSAAAVALMLGRDAGLPLSARIFAAHLEDGSYSVLTTPGRIAVVVALTALALLVGFIQRQQLKVREAARTTHDARAEADDLRGALGQVEERELLAREIHDTVAHRLSLVSLHAAALERATDDPDLAALAATVRDDAHGSLDEMRDLIALMRAPGGLAAAQEARRPVSPDALALLVEESRRASGVPASFTMMLDDGTSLPPPTARAAHRVLQESLTNARKHGQPGAGKASITGGPRTGVRLVVSNPVGSEPSGVPGAGRGLEGVRERVSLLGGTVTVNVEHGVHTLEAWLPWSPVPAEGPGSPAPLAGEANLPQAAAERPDEPAPPSA